MIGSEPPPARPPIGRSPLKHSFKLVAVDVAAEVEAAARADAQPLAKRAR